MAVEPEQHVLGLEVAVDHRVLLVEVLERERDLAEDDLRAVLGELVARGEVGVEVAAAAVREQQVEVRRVLERVVQPHDVRVARLLQNRVLLDDARNLRSGERGRSWDGAPAWRGSRRRRTSRSELSGRFAIIFIANNVPPCFLRTSSTSDVPPEPRAPSGVKSASVRLDDIDPRRFGAPTSASSSAREGEEPYPYTAAKCKLELARDLRPPKPWRAVAALLRRRAAQMWLFGSLGQPDDPTPLHPYFRREVDRELGGIRGSPARRAPAPPCARRRRSRSARRRRTATAIASRSCSRFSSSSSRACRRRAARPTPTPTPPPPPPPRPAPRRPAARPAVGDAGARGGRSRRREQAAGAAPAPARARLPPGGRRRRAPRARLRGVRPAARRRPRRRGRPRRRRRGVFGLPRGRGAGGAGGRGLFDSTEAAAAQRRVRPRCCGRGSPRRRSARPPRGAPRRGEGARRAADERVGVGRRRRAARRAAAPRPRVVGGGA